MQNPVSFDDLAASRKTWIDQVLRPWCRQANSADLKKADAEWFDIAGRADAAATLWTWAWERFPELVHPELPGVDETHAVTVRLTDGSQYSGFPDARQSIRGRLVLIHQDESGRFCSTPAMPIDAIQSVSRETGASVSYLPANRLPNETTDSTP